MFKDDNISYESNGKYYIDFSLPSAPPFMINNDRSRVVSFLKVLDRWKDKRDSECNCKFNG